MAFAALEERRVCVFVNGQSRGSREGDGGRSDAAREHRMEERERRRTDEEETKKKKKKKKKN